MTQFGGKFKLKTSNINITKNIIFKNIKDVSYYDDIIFPSAFYNKYQEYLKLVENKHIGDVNAIINPIKYLATFDTYSKVINEEGSNTYNKIFKDMGSVYSETANKKIYLNELYKIINTPIVSYKFMDIQSLFFVYYMNKFNFINENTKIFLMSKNCYMLDACNYFIKYKIGKNINEQLDFHFYTYKNTEQDIKITSDYLIKNKIKSIEQSTILDNKNIDKIINKMSNYDVAIYDIFYETVCIKEPDIPCLYLINRNLSFMIPGIILSLKKLNKGGTLILYSYIFTKKYMINIIIFLASFFKNLYIESPYKFVDVTTNIFIFKNYKGNCDFDLLYEINKLNYENDNTGGFGKINKCVDNLIDIKVNNNIYDDYKKLCDKIIIKQTDKIKEAENVINNKTNNKYIEQLLFKNIFDSLILIKKSGIEIPNWIELPNMFENISIRMFNEKKIDDIIKLHIKDRLTINISPTFDIDYNFIKSKLLAESIYQYLDTHNLKKYKYIEGLINTEQKRLNKALFDEYNININGQYVSRAWLKVYGLIHKTKILNKFKDNEQLKVFHICEAPGCFISAMMYYVQNYTNIKTYDWHAQTLKVSMIGDEYGFIKENRDKWDFGKTGSGDVTDFDNITYYFEKYIDMDGIIGDCGEAWSENSTTNLAYYQLLYALLIPKRDGFFVMKTFAGNINNYYLSALSIILSYYKKVKIYKSNINFWSPEIYIVGSGFYGTSENEKKIILDAIKNKKYLTNTLNTKFCKEYENLTQEILDDQIESKKMLIFMSENEKTFQKIFPKISKLVDEKNIKYVKKYFQHLTNIDKFIEKYLI